MPAKEIKELRQAGRLDEAYEMAKAELEADLSNIWGKRNLSWVLYAQLDVAASNLDAFITKINEVKELDLPASEEMFFENLSIVISKAARVISHEDPIDYVKIYRLFDSIKELSLKRNSKWYSVLFNAIHKGMKESNRYIEFADWWDFQNFRPEDFQKEKMPNGKEVMAIAEQAYIAYAKHLLPKKSYNGETSFNIEKANIFLPKLAQLCEEHPSMQYPPLFHAKLLIATGDKQEALNRFLPFARKKRNDFWVWDLLADLHQNNPELVFSCYCRALSCRTAEEMLTKLRQKFAALLIEKRLYNEAKTEILKLLQVKNEAGHLIPGVVNNWTNSDWYSTATPLENNFEIYKKNKSEAEEILFLDFPETKVFVEFVNVDRKIVNYITADDKRGFFKYERLISKVSASDTLAVRFKSISSEEISQVFTIKRINDADFESNFIKEIEGQIKIQEGKSFGFVNDIYIHPSIISRNNLVNGQSIKGKAIKSWHKERKSFGWKFIEIKN